MLTNFTLLVLLCFYSVSSYVYRRGYCKDGFYMCETHSDMYYYRNCVPQSWICDNLFDCPDQSDEKYCSDDWTVEESLETTSPMSTEPSLEQLMTSADYTFTCDDDHNAVQASRICDGNNDCDDGSDELNCKDKITSEYSESTHHLTEPYTEQSTETYSELSTRDPYYFICANGETVPLGFVCDGQNDCRDGSDELGCILLSSNERESTQQSTETYSEQSTRNPNYFYCNNGKIIPSRYVCDRDNDCLDNSDEVNCRQFWSSNEGESTQQSTETYSEKPTRRLSLFFNCANGNIILTRYICDGDNDCGDKSDEVHCSKYGTLDQRKETATYSYQVDKISTPSILDKSTLTQRSPFSKDSDLWSRQQIPFFIWKTAIKMKLLNSQTYLQAERLIDKVLFEAQMGNLTYFTDLKF